jgi:hypothetical protein
VGYLDLLKSKIMRNYEVLVVLSHGETIVYWKGTDENEAYDQYINARSENLKKNDVILSSNGDEIEYYDSLEDLEQDEVDACDVCGEHISECACPHYGSEAWVKGEPYAKGGMVKKSDFTMLGVGALVGGIIAFMKK